MKAAPLVLLGLALGASGLIVTSSEGPSPLSPAHAQPATTTRAPLDTLLAELARIEGFHASFREEKQIALLRRPIVSSGTIDYARPRLFVRRTTSPATEVVVIRGATLEMARGEGATERIDLATQPVVRSFVDSFVALLAGDRASLEQSYRLTLEGDIAHAWTLVLVPHGRPLDALVREVRFEGDGATVLRMTFLEASGDRSVTTFTEVDRARRFTPAERERVFRVR